MTVSLKTTLSDDAIVAAIRKLDDLSTNISGSWESMEAFGRLLYLRDELSALQSDIGQIIQSVNRQPFRFILVPDDTPIRAYAALSDVDLKCFTFPLGKDPEGREPESEDVRAAQYLFRTDRLFRTARYPVLVVPPTVDACLRHLEYFSTQVSQRIAGLNNRSLDAELRKVVEQRESYSDILRAVNPSLAADWGLLPAASDADSSEQERRLDINSQTETNAAVSIGTLIAIDNELRVIKRLRRVLGSGNNVRLLHEFKIGEYRLHPRQPAEDRALAAFQEDVTALTGAEAIGRYEPVLRGLMEVMGRLRRQPDVMTFEPEWDWRSAATATFVHALNDLQRRHGVNVEFQLVTHRSRLATAIRAFGEGELFIPVRHPKFLAAQIPANLIDDIAPDVDRIATRIGDFVKVCLDSRQVDQSSIDRVIRETQESWITLKRPIYSAEAGFSFEFYRATLADRRSRTLSADRIESILKPLKQRESDPRRLLAADLTLKTKSLLSVFLRSLSRGSSIAALWVPEHGHEKAHWMLLPNSGVLRYILKMEDIRWMIGEDGCPENRDIDQPISIDLGGLLTRYDDLGGDRRWFALALVCAVIGNWSLAERYLSEKEVTESEDRNLCREAVYLRHFALRAVAAERARKATDSMKFLTRAYQLTRDLVEEKAEDMRFQLSRVGTVLEILALPDELRGDLGFLGDPDKRPTLLVDTCRTVAQSIDDKLKGEPVCSRGQRFYWSYMTARASQMRFMIYTVTWAGWTPNRLFDHFELISDRHKEWKAAFRQFDRSWKDCRAIIDGSGLFTGKEPVGRWHPDCPVRAEYPAAVFLWHFARLHFELENGDVGRIGAGAGVEDLVHVAERTKDTLLCLAGMEESCRRLTFNGFPRRLFRKVKQNMYGQSSGLLTQGLERNLESLRRGLGKTL